jgi:hypothetical protein
MLVEKLHCFYPGIPSTPSVTDGESEPKSNGIGRRSFPFVDK